MELKDAWNQQSHRRADQPSIVRGAADGHARRVHTASVVAWMGMMQFRTAMAWQRKDEADSVAPWFLRDSSGFQIDSELSPLSNEAVFDKITMSAFEGTPLTLALRDCGILSVAIVGIATEIGIEPTARHAADLCYIPVIIADACGAGDEAAAQRSLESLRFAGDAIISDIETFTDLLKPA
jgi:biuret amidohydrolase